MLRTLRLLLSLLSVCVGAVMAQQRPPNVLLLFADDLRRDAVGAFGSVDAHTPSLDALAARGTRLTNISCMGSRHGAVCVPSRAMLMSGRGLTHVRDDLTDFDERAVTTLPEVLRGHGYATFMAGKWHNGKAAAERAFPEARSVFLGGMCDHNDVPLVDITGGRASQQRRGEGHSSTIFADAAVAFLDEHASRRAEAPFFAYVAFTAPHDPRDPPPEWLEQLRQRPLPEVPYNFRGQHGLDLGKATMAVRDEQLLDWPRDPDLLREQLAEYRALVADLDAQIGRILEALDRHGMTEDTLVVFASDHGLALGSHGLIGKQSLYEHSMGSPVVLAGPGVPAGQRREGLGYVHDLFATICATAGAAPPAGVDAVDLWPLLRGEGPGRAALLTIYAKFQRAVRDDRFKLIRLPDIDRTLLFDLRSDPHEMYDLAQAPMHAAALQRMQAMLVEAQRQAGDPQPWTAAEVQPATIDMTGHERQPDRWQPRWIREKYFRTGPAKTDRGDR